jgi:uncharacterized flavoprotein (TIGR03862 family)
MGFEDSIVDVAVIGGGPAGLMAAEAAQEAGRSVQVFDAMPSVGRKLLIAGRGGLNLTHSESADTFAGRYGERRTVIEGLLADFDAAALRRWTHDLGIETFVGSSGRVFPVSMKASPLLRAWLKRLSQPRKGPAVQFGLRHRWVGWAEHSTVPGAQALMFETPQGPATVMARSVILAMGGASWSRLGSTGAWVPLLVQKGVAVAPLLPANCGFDVQGGWSPFFSCRFAGHPLKSVGIEVKTSCGQTLRRKGEFVATQTGVEGSLVYAASNLLRDDIIRTGSATLFLDLFPESSVEQVVAEVAHPRGKRSLSSHLKSRLKLDGIKAALLYELLPKSVLEDDALLGAAMKALPIRLGSARPIDEAISTAGGVLFEVLTPDLMLEQMSGVFCAGEMLDWEAPTGGYLLTACLASGRRAGAGAHRYLG